MKIRKETVQISLGRVRSYDQFFALCSQYIPTKQKTVIFKARD
jgi:hypothetical protein